MIEFGLERHGTNLTNSQDTMSLVVWGLGPAGESKFGASGRSYCDASGGTSGGGASGGGRGARQSRGRESLSRGGKNTHTYPSRIFRSLVNSSTKWMHMNEHQ